MPRKGVPKLDTSPEGLFGGGEGPTAMQRAQTKYNKSQKGKKAWKGINKRSYQKRKATEKAIRAAARKAGVG